MPDATKVLTVTFGTFSCTLKGFDDPFPVLRQIADYFQQLTAENPEFGTRGGLVTPETLTAISRMTGGTATSGKHGEVNVVAQDGPLNNIAAPDAETIDAAPAPAALASDATAPLDPIKADAPEAKAEPIDERATRRRIGTSIAGMNRGTAKAERHLKPVKDEDNDKLAPLKEAAKKPAYSRAAASAMAAVAARKATKAVNGVKPRIPAKSADRKPDANAADTPKPATWTAELMIDPPVDPRPLDEPSTTVGGQTVQHEKPVKLTFGETPGLDRTRVAELAPPLPPENDAVDLDAAFATLFGEEIPKEPALDLVPTGFAEPPEPYAPVKPDTALNAAPLPDFEPDIDRVDARPIKHASPLLGLGAKAPEAKTQHLSPMPDLDAAPDHSPEPEPSSTEPSKTALVDAAPLVLTTAMSVVAPGATDDVTDAEAEAEDTKAPGPATPPVLRLVEPVIGASAGIEGAATLREFAAKSGASSLPELLEATAAYVTLVDGQRSFTRGQIMRMVDTFVDDGPFTQEARIKSFGALIRGGRLHRTDTGDFELSRAARASYEPQN